MKCFELYHKLKSRFREGTFNMRKWVSNNGELTEIIKRAEVSLSSEPELSCKATPTLTEPNIEEEDWAVSNSNNTVNEEPVIKVMGVQWDRMEDNFDFDLATFSTLALDGTFTKRTLLSSTAQFYDPLGLLSPVILTKRQWSLFTSLNSRRPR